MKVENLALQHVIRFTGNKSDFTKQPAFLLTNNLGLTGDDFIAVYRITRGQGDNDTYRESDAISADVDNSISGDGVLGITLGSSQGLTSATGSNRITSNSVNVGASSFTAAGNTYTIVTSMKGTEEISVIINDGGNFQTDLTITALPTINSLNVLGNGIRPKGRQSSTYVIDATTDMNGAAGSADITTYLYNQQEQQQVWASSGLTGVFDLSFNGLSASIQGKAAGRVGDPSLSAELQTAGSQGAGSGTVTGWTTGPIEGGFRLDNSSYIEGLTSSLFNTRNIDTTGMTMMTYVRFHTTGTEQSIMNICGGVTTDSSAAGEGIRLYMSPGGNASTTKTGASFCFSNTESSITAGALTTANGTVGKSTNNMVGAHNILLNKWYHVAGVVNATTGNLSGMSIYVDGHKMPLARTRLDGDVDVGSVPISGNLSGYTNFVNGAINVNTVAIPKPTSPRLLIGSSRVLAGATVSHDVAVTRVFNRALSDSEVFQNFIGTIPSNAVIENIKIV